MKQTRADKPHRQHEPHIDFEDKLEYRVVCNSEHFLVLNPQPIRKKREGEKEPRKKGSLLIRK